MRVIFLFVLICLFSAPAHAHSPYLIKEGVLADPEGKQIILEKLYGDGIFSADPVSFQVRSANGAVLAFTPTVSQIGVFCPHIKFCWAFVHGGLLPVGIGLKLDYKSIDWKHPPNNEKLEGKRGEEFEKYLNDKNAKRAYGFEYPEYRKTNPIGFEEIWWIFPLSPLFIIAGYILPLTVMLLLTTVPVFLHRAIKKYLGLKNILAIFVTVLIVFLTLGYAAFYLLALFISWFTIGTPALYLLGAILLGLIIPKRIIPERLPKS